MHASTWARRTPLTGIGFVVFFIASVVVSAPPADNVPDSTWIANYGTHSEQLRHIATGYCLVFAGLCLASFLTHLWTRISAARAPERISPLPLVAAGAAAACTAVGGVLMAGIAGSLLFGSAPMPGAELLRFGNDVGFAMVGVAGMLAAALSIACLSVQAHAAGIFGKRMLRFSIAVAAVLLAAVAFVPILALLVWLIVAVRILTRQPVATARPEPLAA